MSHIKQSVPIQTDQNITHKTQAENQNPQYWAVLPAAGSGKRFASSIPKQYLSLLGQTVMQHSVNRLCELPVSGCVLAIAADDTQAQSLEFAKPALMHWVTGGSERMDSVLAALDYLIDFADEKDWVLVHDVARPCIRVEDLQQLIQQVTTSGIGGLLAVPVRDTLKLASQHTVMNTVSRDNLWQCQTPQMFRFGQLRQALRQAKAQQQLVTDEASAMELMGHTVQLVAGSSSNIKITYPEDLALATAILQAQKMSS